MEYSHNFVVDDMLQIIINEYVILRSYYFTKSIHHKVHVDVLEKKVYDLEKKNNIEESIGRTRVAKKNY